MSYEVVAPLVLAKDPEGKVHERYQGSVIQWLSDEQAKHFLELGLVVDLGGNESADEPADGKPAKTATKPVLVDWLVANAAKEDGSDFTAEELGAHDKAALWALVDSVEG